MIGLYVVLYIAFSAVLFVVGELLVNNKDFRVFIGLDNNSLLNQEQVDAVTKISKLLVILGRILQLIGAILLLISLSFF
jgi:hypothetical protein